MRAASDRALWRRAAILLLVYILAGKFGLTLAATSGGISVVWPPTGVALAALLLFGTDLWPAVFAGAFVVNMLTGVWIVASLGSAAGNTMEAVLGVMLINRFANGPRAVERAQDIIKLGLIAAFVSTPVSATIGVGARGLSGLIPRSEYGSEWITWWLGNAAGACLLTPMLLSFFVKGAVRWTHARAAEAVLLAATLVVVAELVFGGLRVAGGSQLPLEYICLPVLLWAAFRFGLRETTVVVFGLSMIALRGTMHSNGPFAGVPQQEALGLVQTFMGVTAIMMGAVAALVQHQRHTEKRIQRFNRELELRVTERTEQLARSEKRLVEAQRVAHIGSWEWDVVADQFWWSDELLRIYGVERQPAPDSYMGFISRVHPQDRPLVEERIRRALANRQPFGLEHRIMRPDGDVRAVYGSGEVVLDSTGRAVRLTGTAQDVTEWKRLEAERAELIREQAARREAEQANRLKDAFLATLSHELRTPLNAIVGWLQILRSRVVDPSVGRAIGVLDRNATILRRLIEDMLDVSAILSGKLLIEREPFGMNAAVDEVIDSLRPTAEAKQIVIERVPSSGCALVEGDRRRMQQVVANLLSNALKFTEPGGRVLVEIAQRDQSVVLRVSDTGIGISPDSLPFIFDAFRQADASLTRTHGGLGLGLAIVREVVELHGGSVRAESGSRVVNAVAAGGPVDGISSATPAAAGPGSTFTVVLPAAQSRRAAADSDIAGRPDAAPALGGLHVLAVDDDEDSRELLGEVLASAGANLVSAASAREGLTACADRHPDLLLVDLAMPQQDGYAFVAQARKLGVRAPAIAITAYADETHRARALAGGFAAHLSKPFEVDELLGLVASLAGRAAS